MTSTAVEHSKPQPPWIGTFSGRQVSLTAPKPHQISIEDIAKGLAKLCRFNGQSKWFYSVAQHSVLVSMAVPKEHALWGLLHDAAEAFLGDLATPVKSLCPDFDVLENRMQWAISERFGLSWPMPAEVKKADLAVLGSEIQSGIFKQHGKEWPKGLSIMIEPWDAQESYEKFIKRFVAICPR